MWFISILSFVAIIVQISFVTVAIAAGLYYLAELVEEYTVISKKVIWWVNLVSTLVYIGFWTFENFPLSMTGFGLLAQAAHFYILKSFPFVSFTSPAFIVGVILIFVNHYMAFGFFAANYYAFSEVMAYFTLCLWMVPLALFVSLSANENVLPTMAERCKLGGDDVVSNYFSSRKKRFNLLGCFTYAKESILPQRTRKEF